MNTAKTLMTAGAILSACYLTHGQGMLGQRYAEASLSFTTVDVAGGWGDFDIYGLEGRINLPTVTPSENSAVGVDFNLGLGYGFTDSDEYVFDEIETSSIDGTAVIYYQTSGSAKPFLALGLGYMAIDYDDDFYAEDDDWFYLVGVGVEFAINEKFSLVPMVTYVDPNDGDSAWTYSLAANYWLSDLIGLGFGIGFEDEDVGDAISYTGSIRFRF